MFGIKIHTIPYDSNYQVDIRKVKRAINSNTVVIVGSFPNFPHGICDNIEALSEIALEYDIPLHVDACLGGFLTAFYRYSNINFPKFDFNLKGVASISADLHKYGLCPKGISVLFYKNKEYRKNQYFIYPKWMGGVYPSPSIAGSRSPAFVAAAYAILMYLGKNTYVNQAKKIYEAISKIKKFVKENCPEIQVIGNPCVCVIAFTGKKIMYLFDEMNRKKWALNIVCNPQGFSFVLTSANIKNVENGDFLKDLKDSYDYVI
jgi:sphinganine-1-phosphate aldolase